MLKALFLFHLQEHDLDEERSQVYLFTFSYVMRYLSFLDTDAAISDITITTDYWPDKPICFFTSICLPNASLANFSTCWVLWRARGGIFLTLINTTLAKEVRELTNVTLDKLTYTGMVLLPNKRSVALPVRSVIKVKKCR